MYLVFLEAAKVLSVLLVVEGHVQHVEGNILMEEEVVCLIR